MSTIRKLLCGLAAVSCLALWEAPAGEATILSRDIAVCDPIRAAIPVEAITPGEWAAGRITLYIAATNPTGGWTLYAKPDVMFLTDGENRRPLANPPGADHYGGIPSGTPIKATFPLPPQAREKGLHFENTMGIYGMIAEPTGPYRLEIWKGLRPTVKVHVDAMNRNYLLDASDVGDEGLRFHYTPPDGRTVSTTLATFRGRVPEDGKPFAVKVAVDTRSDGRVERTVEVAPRAETTPPPLPVEDVQVGICYYRTVPDSPGADRHGSTAAAPRQAENVRDFIDRGLGNLFVLWDADQAYREKEDAFLAEMAERGLSMMTIYRSDPTELLDRYRRALKGRFLENNIGEYAGYLYQDIKSAQAVNMPTDMTNVLEARDHFVNRFIGGRVRAEQRKYRYLFSTSGSALAGYELAGGVDFMCSELYAVGAANLGYATAEMRGAARRWKPEYWGGWLAAEWQTQSIPYEAPQKYDLLKVGLYQQYLMGTSVMVLESGADFTQAADYTVTLPGSESKGQPSRRGQPYDGPAPTRYRAVMKEFTDFVRASPRDQGTPDTRMAVLLGNGDGWVGAYHDWFAVWAQHGTAAKNRNWLYGEPERSWQAAMSVFFPVVPGGLGGYANHWTGGSPFGQADVVGIDEDLRASDLARYRLACLAGWNTMTPELVAALRAYASDGGTLFLSVPHLSGRTDREYRDYAASDLLGAGGAESLVDARITGRRPANDAELDGGAVPLDAAKLGAASLAEAELGDGVETVIRTRDGRPVLVSQPLGRGRVYLLLTWEYPGAAGVAPLYRDILRHLAGGVEQDVRIAPVDGRRADLDAIGFAAYPSKAYFLNTDCVSPRSFEATVDGRTERITLAPAEFRTLARAARP